MNHAKVVSQKTILESQHFHVKENKLKLPNGEIRTHRNVYKGPSVFLFPLSKKHELYLIRQYRYLLQKEVIEAIAGYVDKGESSIAAAKRELKEEGGIEAGQIEELARLDLSC